MTVNERIKQIRKEKNLNQKQFAFMLGFTQSGASYMEQPGNNVSDSTIKAICTVFNVNEEWLRNGIDPMYIELNTFSLDEFVKQRGATDLELQILKTYFELDSDTRKMLVNHFRKVLTTSAPVEKEKTSEDMEEEYKKIRSNSVSKKGSIALSSTSDTATDGKAVNN